MPCSVKGSGLLRGHFVGALHMSRLQLRFDPSGSAQTKDGRGQGALALLFPATLAVPIATAQKGKYRISLHEV